MGAYRHLTSDEVHGLRDMATQEDVKRPAPKFIAKKSEPAPVKPVHNVAADGEIWGRGEEKRRSRVQAPRGSAAGVAGSRGERPGTATGGQRTMWPGKEKDSRDRGGISKGRPTGAGDRRPAFGEKRPAAKPSWNEQRGPSTGPRRPAGERPRTFVARTADHRGPRQEERTTRDVGREPGRDEKRSWRPAAPGKVYGTRNQGPDRSSNFNKTGSPKRTEERPRPFAARTADHRGPGQEERTTRAVGREPGRDEKRTWRPAAPGKVYGTRNQGPARTPGFKPTGQKRPASRPSGPRPSKPRGSGGRRS